MFFFFKQKMAYDLRISDWSADVCSSDLLVVGNNIVLIDTYAILRREGVAPLDAVIRTGAQRLRPVFLTTITTILGLLPMCFMVNIDLVAREVTEIGRAHV